MGAPLRPGLLLPSLLPLKRKGHSVGRGLLGLERGPRGACDFGGYVRASVCVCVCVCVCMRARDSDCEDSSLLV